MPSFLESIIPDSIDELFERWNKDDNDQYRLTLLHRNGNNLYCLLSRGLQEIKDNTKIDLGMTIAISKKLKVDNHYDLVFHERKIDDGYYLTFEEDNPLLKTREKVIPFCYHSELPSVIVSKNIKDGLLDYLEMAADVFIRGMEYLGEHNLAKSVFYLEFSKEFREKNKLLREAKKSIRENIEGLLHEETSPSVFIQPPEYLEEDKSLETQFVQQSMLKSILKCMPLLAIAPYSVIMNHLLPKMNRAYEQKFEQNKEEEAKILLNDFIVGHPKALKGMKKTIEICKHISNITMYTALTGATALAYAFAWPVISYPLIACSGASGLTMLTNMVLSKGKNSSGILSSIIDRKYRANKLE